MQRRVMTRLNDRRGAQRQSRDNQTDATVSYEMLAFSRLLSVCLLLYTIPTIRRPLIGSFLYIVADESSETLTGTLYECIMLYEASITYNDNTRV